MEDSYIALWSYLSSIGDYGFVFRISNNNNEFIDLAVYVKGTEASSRSSFMKRVKCNELGISDLLEQVEEYVNSMLDWRIVI